MEIIKFKSWLLFRYGMFVLLGIIAICTYNYLLDPYGVLRKDYSGVRSQPNQNFAKVEHILSHPQKYNSFIFGSSRVGRINPTLIPNGKYYNMTSSLGLPKDHLEQIKLFLENNVKIKNIIIGLGEESYTHFPQNHHNQPMRKPHYRITKENVLKFYSFYLLKKPSYPDFYNLIHTEKFSKYDISDTGTYSFEGVDEKIEKNIDLHMNKVSDKLIYKKPHVQSYHNLNGTLSDIKEIIEITNIHHIKLIFFIHPIYKITYLNTDLILFSKFLSILAELTNYYDFSGLNSITSNFYYYFEPIHYRPSVGNMIIGRILKIKSIKVPGDFGVLITKDNIIDHLIMKDEQISKIGYQRKTYLSKAF